MNILKQDNIQCILSFLKPKFAYNFIITCKLFHLKFNIKSNLIYEINFRLNKIFGDKTDDFKQLLKDTNSVISGSFIIQCLLNEYWNTDIDIYIPTIGNNIYQPDELKMTYERSDLDNFMHNIMKYDG